MSSNENALNVDRVTDAIAQSKVDNAAKVLDELPEVITEPIYYSDNGICLTIPDKDAKGDCICFDVGFSDCVIITGREAGYQKTVSIAPNTIPTLVMVLSGWYEAYKQRQSETRNTTGLGDK